jgi:hypothetical protein
MEHMHMYAGTMTSSPGALFTAEILVRGISQPIYTGPDGYRWVAGIPGEAYQVRVVPLLAGRIEVALGIGGRNALEDKIADLSASRGMVITDDGHRSPALGYVFKGFRVDDSTTREFLFGSVTGSVADQAGTTGSVGTIGLAGWQERQAVRQPMASKGMYGGGYESVVTASASAGPDLGTHAGDTRYDPVGRTTFERDGGPDVLEIGYRTMAALDAMGVTPGGISVAHHAPAFPGRATGYEKYRP